MKTTKAYTIENSVQEQFKYTCLMLNLKQSNVIEMLMRDFNIKNKAELNEKIIKIKNENNRK